MAFNLYQTCHNAALVFIDLDGTLLNSSHVLTERTKQAIIKLSTQKRIILSSARPLCSVLHFANMLQLTSLVSALNGAVVADTNYKIHDRALIESQLLTLILDQIINMDGVSINIYSGEDWLVPKIDHRIQKEINIIGFQPSVIDKQLTYGCAQAEKLLLMCDYASEQDIVKLLAQYAPYVSMTFSKPGYFEITAKRASKINSAAFIANHYNLSLKQCIAIGDGEADLDMLVGCGAGIAMDNAIPALKNIASTIIKTNDEDGVAIFLETIDNIREDSNET